MVWVQKQTNREMGQSTETRNRPGIYGHLAYEKDSISNRWRNKDYLRMMLEKLPSNQREVELNHHQILSQTN